MTRLAVLPFRLLRTDPEIEHLSLSLADVIANALSGLESLVCGRASARPSMRPESPTSEPRRENSR